MKKRIVFYFLLLSFLTFLTACRTTREDYEGRVFYQIFVRAFADSSGNGIGDFKGITENLDYLEDLGIKGIWLMPINPSPSYHGYDVTDYYDVNPDYGTLDDFKKFVIEANKRNIKVIIDLVINHTSTQHPWFISAKDPDSKYRDYYHFKDVSEPRTGGKWYSNSINGGNGNDFYYAFFWDQMPDLNFNNERVFEEVMDIAKFWLDLGVDGFRLDGALHIFEPQELADPNLVVLTENINFWQRFRDELRRHDPNVYLVGEVWTTQSTVAAFYQGLDSNFNFELSDRMINSARGNGNMYYARQIEMMHDRMAEFSEEAIDAPFLTNHDQTRLMTRLGNNMTIAKLSAEMLLTQKGNPFIYYGEEIGMRGDKPDEDIRLPFKWTSQKTGYNTRWRVDSRGFNTDVLPVDQQKQDPDSLYNHYRTLIRLRNEHIALSNGELQFVNTRSAQIVMLLRHYESRNNKQAVLVVHNLSNNVQTYQFENVEKLSLIYQSRHNADHSLDSFAPKSTKIFEIPFDAMEDYL